MISKFQALFNLSANRKKSKTNYDGFVVFSFELCNETIKNSKHHLHRINWFYYTVSSFKL